MNYDDDGDDDDGHGDDDDGDDGDDSDIVTGDGRRENDDCRWLADYR